MIVVNEKEGKMRKGSAYIFTGNLLGKIIGLFREALLAAFFGTGIVAGAYRLAQSATLIPVDFFTADSLKSGFVPLYRRCIQENNNSERVMFWTYFFVLCVLSVLISLCLWFGASFYVGILAPNIDNYSSNIAISFIRIMALGIPWYVLGILFSYLGMGNEDYSVFALRSSIQSIGLILGTFLSFYLKTPVFLAWGFSAAYFLFFLWGLQKYNRLGLLKWPENFTTYHVQQSLKTIWKTIRPLLLLPFLLQGYIAIERRIASGMGLNVVAALDYAKVVAETGTLLLAAPLATVGLVNYGQISNDDLKKRLYQLIPLVLIISIPTSAFIGFNASTIVEVLYARGVFDLESIEITSTILKGFSIGVWAHILSYIFLRSLSAKLRNTEVFLINSVSLFIGTLFIVVFARLMGPMVFGVGSSIYGILLLAFSCYSLGVQNKTSFILLWLFLGVIGYWVVCIYSPEIFSKWLSLLFDVGLFILYWVLFIFIVNPLRVEFFTISKILLKDGK